MAQVEATPGKSVANGSVTVVASQPATPAQTARANATVTTVSYTQSEVGRHGEDKRS